MERRLKLTQVGMWNHNDATTRLGDGSAREPTKVVTSCDKSRGRGMNLMDPRIAELDLLALSAIPRYKEGKGTPRTEASQ